MAQLISDLKVEHTRIAESLSKVSALGIATDEGKRSLLNAKQSLLAHIRKEDERLYPALKKAAATDNKLRQTLETFARDMDTTSRTAVEFFDKYGNGGASGLQFATDFGRLYAVLGNRMRKEESILYAEYEKLAS